MYIPPAYKINEPQEICQFIKTHNFGTLISTVEGNYFATHLPLLLHEMDNRPHFLTGHMAKANPQWRTLDGQKVLIIFQGAHAYISSSWYPPEYTRHPAVAVPTWNYTAVHLYGTFRVIGDEEEARKQMDDQVRFYEPQSILLDNAAIYEHLFKAITSFRIEITNIEAKYKIHQKDDELIREGIMEALLDTRDCANTEMAHFMKEYYKNLKAR